MMANNTQHSLALPTCLTSSPTVSPLPIPPQVTVAFVPALKHTEIIPASGVLHWSFAYLACSFRTHCIQTLKTKGLWVSFLNHLLSESPPNTHHFIPTSFLQSNYHYLVFIFWFPLICFLLP